MFSFSPRFEVGAAASFGHGDVNDPELHITVEHKTGLRLKHALDVKQDAFDGDLVAAV